MFSSSKFLSFSLASTLYLLLLAGGSKITLRYLIYYFGEDFRSLGKSNGATMFFDDFDFYFTIWLLDIFAVGVGSESC